MSRATQSLLFAVIYSIHLVVVMGLIQWLVIRPLCALRPARRGSIVRAWMRAHARSLLALARSVGGMRLEVQGQLPAAGVIVLMNHQSLLDIPVAVSLMRGPAPLIPTRARYGRGVPVISGLLHLDDHPLMAQGERATRAEHRALAAAVDRVARGERSLLFYPEGHRTRDGELQPFMTPGLALVLRRAPQRPVYLAVVDGLWRLRGFADIALRLAGTRVRVVLRGPFTVPVNEHEQLAFIDRLRAEMLTTLDGLRERPVDATATPAVPRARLAG